MRIEQLEYLCEIAKRKSMNLASSKLYVSQQTLSTAIKNLEKELDCKLLERTYHGVFPTEIGQELIDISQDMLIRLDQLKLKIAAQNNTQLSGALSIAIEPGINTLIMPKVISHFHKYYPKINTEITVLSRAEVLQAIAEKKYDVGIITTQDNTSVLEDEQISENLTMHEIIDFQWLARVNKQSPLATETSISLRTLLNYPIALNSSTSGINLIDELKKYGNPYIMSTHNYGVAQQLVFDNLAVSLAVKVNNYLPTYFNGFDGEVLNIPIKEPLPFHASYLMHKDYTSSEIVDRFIDSLVKIT
ncbi:MAG: LysR family transcriptional regulator [Peptococcaceae bacterium]|nr:LysR family transcriptional regulator [Peptococcaceae bacterium]MBO5115455.1 LysR family transcriptional regulator [Peptococcaceae bacterium]MBO5301975.1 LysR family transcriptional regulator [Peptococcaceae bacterium]